VTQLDIGLHVLATQVDVAVLEPHFFIDRAGLTGQERRQLGFIEQLELVHGDFNFTGGNILVDGVGIAPANFANGCNHIFRAQRAGFLMHGGIHAFIKDELRHSAAVADIDKNHVAQITPAVHPAEQNNLRSCVLGTQFSAHVRATKIT
jgi:hypothetical protein